MLTSHRDINSQVVDRGENGKILSDHRQDGNVETHQLYK